MWKGKKQFWQELGSTNQFWNGFWNVGVPLKNECELAVDCEGAGYIRTKLLEKPKKCHQREVWCFHKKILIKNDDVKRKCKNETHESQ